jgi:hypothetical protein
VNQSQESRAKNQESRIKSHELSGQAFEDKNQDSFSFASSNFYLGS